MLAVAKRLLDDATLLIEHGRHETASALCIMAFEEIGKTSASRKKEQSGNNHRLKQRSAASLGYTFLILEKLSAAGMKIVRRTELSDEEQAFLEYLDKHPKLKEEYNKDTLRVLETALKDKDYGEVFSGLVGGKLHKLKNQAIYSDGRPKASPMDRANESQRLLAAAQWVLDSVENEEIDELSNFSV